MTNLPGFSAFFRELWGYEPFPWQRMLAERLTGGRWPQVLDLPTAAGKTACIDAAIYALAAQADRPVNERTAPRRIWFVVDRRIVVDEAHNRASEIAAKLENPQGDTLKQVAERMQQVSGTKTPLAAARLRGGILRGNQWARMPSQPAVISSTVDQLGSRLLFRGYGHGKLTASIYAGLAAHDSLILLDEAHCSVPFLQTLQRIESYRGQAWAESPIETPFAFAMLSATPPSASNNGDRDPHLGAFPGAKRDEALDHPLLRQRLSASKPAKWVCLKSGRQDDPLPKKAARCASKFVRQAGKLRVAVIVNRVHTAGKIADLLRNELLEQADVALLTGRLRPLERDRLVKRWKPFLRASQPEDWEKPIVLVSTQCIEVGADFSFDALVTEAAGLDALRQRFGRLNRMGQASEAPAAILIRDGDTKPGQEDPVYGTAIAECWRVLSDGGKRTVLDFGFEALDRTLGDKDLESCFAPRPSAPVLLPAHLDLLCQTAPQPATEPDIRLYLHGTERRSPEAYVVWRADFDPEKPQLWHEIAALCPPNAAEMLSVPLFRLKKWLGKNAADSDGSDPDVEGIVDMDAPDRERIRPVLAWRGRDRSKICRDSSEIFPNDVMILPADYGMDGLGQKETEPGAAMGKRQLDLWEPSRRESGKGAALRLNRKILEPWLAYEPFKELFDLTEESPDWDRDAREALGEAIEAARAYRPSPEEEPAAPLGEIQRLLADLGSSYSIESHPAGGLVLFAKAAKLDRREPDLFADDDDLSSAAGREISIVEHTAMVVGAVEKIIERCIERRFHESLRRAASWHDAGKLDERFQVLLHQGDEPAAAAGGAPLAKSASIPASPARRQAIRDAARYPKDFRHEMLSWQLAERYVDFSATGGQADLVGHLIASHHGHARPFAPVCRDSDPPAVSGEHLGIPIEFSADNRRNAGAPHHAASGVSERFWLLTRRYGWWGLAYLETMLRLGDWYGSAFSNANEQSEPEPLRPSNRQPRAGQLAAPDEKIVLSGIDGANPLGFLAALGTLAVLQQKGYGGAKLHWCRSATWQPVITGVGKLDKDEFASVIEDALRGRTISAGDKQRRKDTQKEFDQAKTAAKKAREAIKKLGLRGNERKAEMKVKIEPLEKIVQEKRKEWLQTLKNAVPSPELAIGKRIDCTANEYRNDHAAAFFEDANFHDREPLDFLAAFASDACINKKDKVVQATPFCFIIGSGGLFFLQTAGSLMDVVDSDKIAATLFAPWTYPDEKLSMRWDPVEDRRYALMDRNPTAPGNESRTEWMANLLAYRALVMFPSAPRGAKLTTTAWADHGDGPLFTWSLWERPLDAASIRSLLALAELSKPKPDRSILRRRGVLATFRSRRISVGKYTNFSPAKGI